MNLFGCFMTWAGLRHVNHPIPEARPDESVAAAGQRNAVACRQMSRTTMHSIMASCDVAETVHGVLDQMHIEKGRHG
jgi:hypothetical protein